MQKFIWVAEYDDGTFLREFDDDGSENSFYDIDRNRLMKFHLAGNGKDYWLDCRTGVFHINGEEISVRYIYNGNIYEFMRQNGKYNDIIQFKQASTDIDPFFGIMGNRIELQAIGWKAKLIFEDVEFYLKLILNIPTNGNPEYLYIWVVANKDMGGMLECQIDSRRYSFEAPLRRNRANELNWMWN